MMMSDLILLVCLRDGIKADFSNPDTATIAMIQAADQLEAQQAEIARYKKQIEQMGRTVQHYEHLAMKFSSQADVYSHDRERAWAEIRKLRVALLDAYDNVTNHDGVSGATDIMVDRARAELEQEQRSARRVNTA
jgi:hypothetical protein